MAATTTRQAGRGTFAHGVHPPEHKHFSEDLPIEVVPSPAKVQLPLLQHVGAPSVPVVKAKDVVAMGDMISKGGGFVSALSFRAARRARGPALRSRTSSRSRRVRAGRAGRSRQYPDCSVRGPRWPRHAGIFEFTGNTSRVRRPRFLGQGGGN